MWKFPAQLLTVLLLFVTVPTVLARTDFYRAVYREDPATSISIGWTQRGGSGPLFYYGTTDFGDDFRSYPQSIPPDVENSYHELENRFVRLKNLRPNTTYYFVVCDSDGCGGRYSFRTAPNDPNARLNLIAGGDSRNNRKARRAANLMVSKLNPDLILFGGDFTGGDTGKEWEEWFEDWQLVVNRDGYLPALVPARGNHERTNETLTELFDVKSAEVHYALNFGGNLLRVYTLNTLIPANGDQKRWLERDLNAHTNTVWKMAQYHQTIRPHTARKPERTELLVHWAGLFHQNRMSVVVESDAHVVKTTYPIRPSTEPGSEEGFVRDDFTGTVYVGEGCWGAPLRRADDPKSWTRAHGSFNQFKWMWVGPDGVDIRTVKTDDADRVEELSYADRFREPRGIDLWTPPTGKIVHLDRNRSNAPPVHRIDPTAVTGEVLAMRGEDVQIRGFQANRSGNNVAITWTTDAEPPGMFYEVQRKVGSLDFQTLGRVGGKARRDNQYLYTDIDAAVRFPGQYLEYRLKRITPEGKFTYEEVDRRPQTSIQTQSTTPQPNRRDQPRNNPRDWEHFPKVLADASGQARIRFDVPQGGPVRVRVLNNQFAEVRVQELSRLAPGTHMKAVLLNNLPRGLYYLEVETAGEVYSRYRAVIR